MVQPFRDEERPDSIIFFSRFALVAAALLGVTALAAAQFVSGVNVVEVYAAVVDQNGNPVSGLTRADFTVLEDGRAQTVTAFTEADFPLSVAVGVDRSFSMAPRRRTATLPSVAAAKTFLGELRPQDESMIIAIGSEVEIVAPLSTDRSAQMDILGSIEPWGTTGLYDSILAAIDAIQTAKGRRALVLLSDGNDRYSKASPEAALERARRSDVMIYPVALGRVRPPLFAELATLTGGRSSQPRGDAQLDATMRGIANELHHQYLLGYAPSRPILAGEEQWRTIAVRVNRAGVTVRARDGYLTR
jgi:Ca-activated chloride channel family protein